ncbi:DUF1761 domain-containing protein [Fictibacillus iocasae]|uniref:DUF1761 domain-containing protein n=1 Tax=Fictibacillus iocasae TaxID=2715437 RepID=A0ABW2NMW3_9BACL
MDIKQAIEAINVFAVFAAALSSFLIGGLWYSVLFANVWSRENGLSDEELRNRKMGMIFGTSFLLSVIISFVLAMFLGPDRNGMMGLSAGFMAGLFWVAAAMGITYLFEKKSLSLFFINAGYHVITFTVMGFILGVWK